jgi:hypothetical protein
LIVPEIKLTFDLEMEQSDTEEIAKLWFEIM